MTASISFTTGSTAQPLTGGSFAFGYGTQVDQFLLELKDLTPQFRHHGVEMFEMDLKVPRRRKLRVGPRPPVCSSLSFGGSIQNVLHDVQVNGWEFFLDMSNIYTSYKKWTTE
ncbi:MAG: hypothetical protein FIA97_07020 [Methylococcaceae bacterium]|nr:hypothetical protein [Methylococcaceae bacterium]